MGGFWRQTQKEFWDCWSLGNRYFCGSHLNPMNTNKKVFRINRLQNEGTLFSKDAGFVYKSLWIETNWVIWDFCFYQTNPQNESLRFGFANPDSRVQNLRIRKDSDLRISIFKDSWSTIRYESRIRGHDTVRIHGFAKRIHVFTNLLYESRNLTFWVFDFLIFRLLDF